MTTWTGLQGNVPTISSSFPSVADGYAPAQLSTGPQTARLVTPPVMPQFKMQGFYTTGAVWEVWTSYGFPNLTPPSGHTLVNISFIVLTPSQSHY